MPELAWPWLLLALPLPWLAARVLSPAKRIEYAALRVPYVQQIAALRGAGATPGPSHLRRWLPLLAWTLLCVAAARPQQLGDALQPPSSGRDLMLAVDLSGSMQEQDMRIGNQIVDRLTAIKAVLDDFLTRRQGDRVGLIVFGTRAYAITPLTFDRDSVRQQLADSVAGLAGQETAIGDAIALAVKRLRTQSLHSDAAPAANSRVLILLTDGVSNAGAITPLKAAEIAAHEHVRIHTIGFGGGDNLADPASLFGLALSMPGMGDDVDEQTLAAIAKTTGGRYFRARDTNELAGIYDELDRIEPTVRLGHVERPRVELYPWPLAASLLLGLFALLPWRRTA
jgi:Ca-activated chloride channel family protein